MLKGGLVPELRLERARTTKDVDLRLAGSSGDVLERLQASGALDLGDFMRFEVAPDPDTLEIVGDGVQYDGHRFRAECRLAGKVYGARFGVDVALGVLFRGTSRRSRAMTSSASPGSHRRNCASFRSRPTLAEKLHTYTMLRSRPNTRVKDLPDLALLGTIRSLEAARVREAIERTFGSRHVHPVPARLPPPPEAWAPRSGPAWSRRPRW